MYDPMKMIYKNNLRISAAIVIYMYECSLFVYVCMYLCIERIEYTYLMPFRKVIHRLLISISS